ncbi:MAG TPA: rRNA maturation RNase YbeY [Steroidobacteraceae bacterium]
MSRQAQARRGSRPRGAELRFRRSRADARSPALEVSVQYATRKPWAPSSVRISFWAFAALGRKPGRWDLAVRVVGAAESRRLNRRYRRKDRPTNVLSFPASVPRADGSRPLGDLVVCAAVVAREAREQDKTLAQHWAHMIVHGTLHLLGYDHERPGEARRMERWETGVLRTLGYPNPYE